MIKVLSRLLKTPARNVYYDLKINASELLQNFHKVKPHLLSSKIIYSFIWLILCSSKQPKSERAEAFQRVKLRLERERAYTYDPLHIDL